MTDSDDLAAYMLTHNLSSIDPDPDEDPVPAHLVNLDGWAEAWRMPPVFRGELAPCIHPTVYGSGPNEGHCTVCGELDEGVPSKNPPPKKRNTPSPRPRLYKQLGSCPGSGNPPAPTGMGGSSKGLCSVCHRMYQLISGGVVRIHQRSAVL